MSHMTNPLATADQLYRWKSFSAIPTDLQDIIFFTTQCLTQAAGILLRLPQSVTAQANVVLARYWLVEPSPLAHEFSDVSAASLFLVAKLSSHPCLPRDICNVYAYLVSPSSALFRGGGGDTGSNTTNTNNNNDPASYYLSESAYAEMHGRILQLESRILLALAFDTHVALPHGLAITYLQALDYLGQSPSASSSKQNSSSGSGDDEKDKDQDKDVARRAIAHLNTALLSPQLLYLTHQPHALAVAAVYGAARDAGARMPECAWWEVFDVDREELGFLVVAMRSLEGWVRQQQQAFAELGRDGMITRRFVEGEMRRRGLRLGGEGDNGNGDGNGKLSEEDAMMRQMDETAVPMEG
ncbi:hypothetical protein SLS62_002391 [Diatrype stigma]|uniref:Uncharacterized protein n=1 Tax=Diatrype stigma TaxID=117547 RepID=A0AAN9YUV5_9PEZI